MVNRPMMQPATAPVRVVPTYGPPSKAASPRIDGGLWGVICGGLALVVLLAVLLPKMLSGGGDSEPAGGGEPNVVAVVSPADADEGLTGPGSDHYKAGLQHQLQGEYAEAIAEFRKAVAQDPKHDDAFMNMGLSQARTGDWAGAIESISKVLVLFPDPKISNNAYNLRGQAHNQLKNHQAAVDDYTQALSANPEWTDVFSRRAQTYLRMDKYEEASRDSEEMIRLEPNSSLGYEFRGRGKFGTGDAAGAIADFTTGMQKNALDADLYYYRGKAYESQGRGAEAKLDLDKAIGMNPAVVDLKFP